MAKSKFTFSDFKIGDTIVTTNNEIGTIVAIKSISYINDKILRKSKVNTAIIDLMPFANDKVRHKGTWYCVLTVAILDKSILKETYYLEGIDFNEVKEILHNEEQLNKTNKISFFNKITTTIKNLFSK